MLWERTSVGTATRARGSATHGRCTHVAPGRTPKHAAAHADNPNRRGLHRTQSRRQGRAHIITHHRGGRAARPHAGGAASAPEVRSVALLLPTASSSRTTVFAFAAVGGATVGRPAK